MGQTMPSLDDIYRKFGDASEAAQLLETELGTILLETRCADADFLSGDRSEEATAILKQIKRCTLGRLLTTLKEKTDSFDHAADLFAKALAERNRLAHSFYRQHNVRKNSEEGRALMLEDLDAIHSTILEAYKEALAIAGIDLTAVIDFETPTRHLKI